MQYAPFSAKQLDFIQNADAFINVADGPVRSGKTMSNLIRFIFHVRTAPPGAMMILGKTQDTIARNVISPLRDIVGAANVKYRRGTGELTLFGRTIYLVGANNEGAQDRVQGATLIGAYCNEATLYPESVFNQLVARHSLDGSAIFLDCNPDSPQHWLYTNYLTNPQLLSAGDVKRWQFTLDDNLSLSQEYKDRLRRLYSGLWYRRYIEGLWVAAEGAIYDMFDPERHVVRGTFGDGRLPKLTNHGVGIDYGTTNATAFEQASLGQDAVMYIAREYYYDSKQKGRRKTAVEYTRDYLNWSRNITPKPEIVAIDPAEAAFQEQMFRAGVARVQDANNSVIDGIRVVSSLLSMDLLKIHESCEGLIREMQSYAWDPKEQERGRDVPLKVADHAVDAARYSVMGMERHWRRWMRDIHLTELEEAA